MLSISTHLFPQEQAAQRGAAGFPQNVFQDHQYHHLQHCAMSATKNMLASVFYSFSFHQQSVRTASCLPRHTHSHTHTLPTHINAHMVHSSNDLLRLLSVIYSSMHAHTGRTYGHTLSLSIIRYINKTTLKGTLLVTYTAYSEIWSLHLMHSRGVNGSHSAAPEDQQGHKHKLSCFF